MCKNIIYQDSQKKKKLQEQAQNVLFRIIRNTKRRNQKLKNKININGHQYADDLKNDKKSDTFIKRRTDPTRNIALIVFPSNIK